MTFCVIFMILPNHDFFFIMWQKYRLIKKDLTQSDFHKLLTVPQVCKHIVLYPRYIFHQLRA